MGYRISPEKLIEIANIYDHYKSKEIEASWPKIMEEAGLSYSGSNLTGIRKQLSYLYGRPFPGLKSKHASRKLSSLPTNLDLIEVGDFDLIFFTDPHNWPHHLVDPSDSFYILLEYIRFAVKRSKKTGRKLLIICGGDAFDGASISRFPLNYWEDKPSVLEELEACKWYMGEIERIGAGAEFHWIIGNHDLRFDRTLANNAHEFEGLEGFSIQEHFPNWEFHFSLLINDKYYFIHNIHSGKHAGYNNVRDTATHTFTGHTHRLLTRRVDFLRDYAVAIEGGTLAPRSSPAFQYTKGQKGDWQEGFVIASVEEERFGYQLVHVDNGCAWIEGEWWEAA